jgi:glycosyltransferase involved in cell wall biosynthesis
MKILVISLFLPQQKASHAGGRFVFELVKELSRRHEIHLATRVEEQELSGLAELKPFCRTIHPYPYKTSAKHGLFMTLRLLINYLGFSRHANRLISRGHYDLVQVEWVEAAILITKKQTPMVLDAHDVITKPAERRYRQARGIPRVLGYLAFKFIGTMEVLIAGRFDRVIVRSAIERDYLNALAPALPLSTIPHPAGLDITDKVFERSNNTILFLASFKYRKTNVDAALYFYRSVLPLVRKKIPDAQFIIAGYGPPDELLSLQKQDPSVIVPGFVNDADEYYKKASVFVAPILVGGGIIVKVLDAMAAGTPVVATTYGNEGIGAEPDRDILIADDPEGFASQVVRVLYDRSFAEKLGNSGQVYIRRHYGKEAVFSKLESLYEQLTAK